MKPDMAPPPMDVPEGSSVVLMSVTVFLQWAAEHTDWEIVDWSVGIPWSGIVYEPHLRRRDAFLAADEGQR